MASVMCIFLPLAIVICGDGDYCYTKINGTEEIIKNDYVGKSFPFMEKGKEFTKKCVGVEIL